MINKKAFLFAALLSSTAIAGNDDKVLEVYVCLNDVGFKMQNAGWVIALDSQLGTKRVDRMLSVGLTLLSSGKSTGYFDEGVGVQWCGISGAKPITVLAAKK